jgi:magnesium transporter
MLRSLLLEGGKVTEGIEPKDWKAAAARPGAVLWVDVEAPKRKTTKLLKEVFGFDDISLEDTLTFSLLPTFDAFADYAFIVIHALGYDEASGTMTSRELDVFLGRNYIVTVHADPIEALEKVFREAGRSDAVLARGPALAAHVIFDRLTDLSYEMVSTFDDDIEQMEERIATGQLEGLVGWTLRVRRQLLLMKKTIGPQRDVLNELARGDSAVVPREAALHFRDDYDRLARVYDQVDTNRELVAAAAEGYRSMVSLRVAEVTLRMNAVMERLTLFATVLGVLTVVVGIWGTNFTGVWEYGVPGFMYFMWALLIVITYALWWWFRKLGWIRQVREAEHQDVYPGDDDAGRRRPS